MTYEGILKSIGKGDFSPVYLLYGTEDLLVEEIIKSIEQRILSPSSRDLNIDILHGNEVTPEMILEKVETFPFLSEKRIVIVKDIDSMETENEKKLLPYITKPSDSTCLILTAQKIDGRKKFYVSLTKKWPSVNLKSLNNKELIKWILIRSKTKKLTITTEAIDLLIELTGTNLRLLDSELEKLSLYAIGKTAGPAEVNEIVKNTWHDNIFSLTDAVGKKEVSRVLHLLNGILESGESPHGVLAMILRQIRLILLVKNLKKNKVSHSEMPGRAGFPPFLLSPLLRQAESFKFQDLKDSFSQMHEADLRLKSDWPPKLVLEKLIFDLCGKSINQTTET